MRLPFTTDIARRAREVGLMYEFNAPGFYSGPADPEAADVEDGHVALGETGTSKSVREELEELGRAIHEMWEWQWTLEFDEQWREAAKGLDEVLR